MPEQAESEPGKVTVHSLPNLQHVIDAVPEMTLVIDSHYGVVLANRVARNLAGGSDPVASCLKCYQFSRNREVPCGGVHEPCPLEEVLETKCPVSLNHVHRDASGNELFFEINAAPLLDSNSEVLHIVESCRNVTEQKLVEKRLQNEKDILAATLGSLPGVFYVFDEQGVFLRWNQELETVSGYSGDEIPRMHPLDFVVAEDRELIGEKIREVLSAGQAAVEAGFLTKCGNVLPFLFRAVRSEVGGKTCVLGVGTDIGDQKRAEESLRRSEQRFRSLVEVTSDWIWETDENGIYTYASPKVTDLLGYEPGEVVGKTAFDFMSPEEAQRVVRLFDDARHARGCFAQIENTNLHKDGRHVVLETSGIPIVDREGNVKGYRGVDRDITERKTAGERLRRSERKYRVLFEQSADATLIIDEDRFVDCNDAAVSLLRYDNKEELLNTHPSKLSPEVQPDGRPSYEKANEMIAIAYDKGSHRFEWDHRRADGEIFPVEVLLTAIPVGEGKILHVVWRDITARKRAEEEREDLISKLESQNAELERFAYSVSHDLKSPLITFKGYLGMLREDLADADTEAVEEDIDRLETASDKMARLLNELLELSRIGRVVNKPEWMTFDGLAREAVELVAGQIAKTSVRVCIKPELPPLYGDRQRLLEVVQNLVDNAVKYLGDQASPVIELGARDTERGTVFYVKDNGIGIELEYHERIFGLFDQLDQNVEGSGVGLALVKRIVESHGGRIWVESEGRERGSTFCFTVPSP